MFSSFDRCPENEELINEVLTKYTQYIIEHPESQVLLSTTYRTEEKKIGFSIHSAVDVTGVVEYPIRAAPDAKRHPDLRHDHPKDPKPKNLQ